MFDVKVFIFGVSQGIRKVFGGALKVLQLFQLVRLAHQVLELLVALHFQDFPADLVFHVATVPAGGHGVQRVIIVVLRDIINAAVGQNFRFGVQFLVGRIRFLRGKRQA